jgi:hypothetical protein
VAVAMQHADANVSKDAKRGRHDDAGDDLHPLLTGRGSDGLYPLYDFDFVSDAVPRWSSGDIADFDCDAGQAGGGECPPKLAQTGRRTLRVRSSQIQKRRPT